jgi:hypothetical protein
VNTINDRNAIIHKIDNMVVTVLDAIADPEAGTGVATYRYNETLDAWILISKSTINSMNFETEELLITNGAVSPSQIPTGNQIWAVKVVDGNTILADIREEDIVVTPSSISGLNAYNGYKLRFTYAYGTITQQMESYMTSKIQDLIGSATLDYDTLGEIQAIIESSGVNTGDISDFEGAL